MILKVDINLPSLAADQKRIVIIGGGFGGLALLKALKNSVFQVVLIDKNNYHTFQPQLYQVATGGLEADSIAFPLRKRVRKYRNLFFRMAEVQAVDPTAKKILTSIGALRYDYLVIATGSEPNYFNFENPNTEDPATRALRVGAQLEAEAAAAAATAEAGAVVDEGATDTPIVTPEPTPTAQGSDG